MAIHPNSGIEFNDKDPDAHSVNNGTSKVVYRSGKMNSELTSESQDINSVNERKERENNMNNTSNEDLIYNGFQIGHTTDAVAVIIDGANFFHYTKMLGIRIDYKILDAILYANFPGLKMKCYITGEHFKQNKKDGSRSFTSGYSSLRSMLDFLSFNRYTVITRPIDVREATTETNINSAMDVEIVTTLYQCAEWADHIVFFGSSRKFVLPLSDLHTRKGKIITIVSSNKEGSAFVSDELRRIDNYVDIGDQFFLDHFYTKEEDYIPQVGTIRRS
jgi:hypothetical protein